MRLDAQPPGERYRVGDLVVDVRGASVFRAGERILLPPRTLELLVALVRLSPRTVRRQELLETVWRNEHVTDQTLSHRVMVLRRALGDRVEEPVYVAGERGFGYRLLPAVAKLEPSPSSAGDDRPGLTRLARLVFTTAGLFPILGAALVLVPGPVPPPRGSAVTLEVGPLTPAEGSSDLAPLADDLSRMLESGLEGVRGLRLARPGAPEAPEMRLEGTVEGSQTTLQARLRLLDLRRHETVWERRFTGGPYALLDARRTMVAAILEALAHRTRLRYAGGPPASPRARRSCLRGEVYWFTFTETGLRRSAESWGDAIAVSPGSGVAHAGASLTAATSGLLAYLPPREAESVSRAEARRAMELDPGLPSARLARGLVRLLFDLDVPGAADDLDAALAADPGDPRAGVLVALALQARGRLDDSVRLLRGAIAEDPHLAAAHYLEGRAHEMAGRWGEGEAAFARALALEPDLGAARRGQAECLDRAHREAEALVVLGRDTTPDEASAGRALRDAWRWSCLAPGGDAIGRVRACLLADEAGRASRALALAVESRSPAIVFVPWDALLTPLSARPAFRAVLGRLGGRGPGAAPG
jgi:DNA-binding winged helix-turn-helix (wHTH) protein